MSTWRRRVVAAITLLAYLAGTVGFPLPAPTIPEEEAAIAGVHRCGCPVEEQERKTCCCSAGGGCCGGGEQPAEEAPVVQWAGGGWTTRCQGGAPAWLVAAVVALPSDLPTWSAEPGCAGRIAPAEQRANRTFLPPPEPPPRTSPG
jgi:hypothetical protein